MIESVQLRILYTNNHMWLAVVQKQEFVLYVAEILIETYYLMWTNICWNKNRLARSIYKNSCYIIKSVSLILKKKKNY